MVAAFFYFYFVVCEIVCIFVGQLKNTFIMIQQTPLQAAFMGLINAIETYINKEVAKQLAAQKTLKMRYFLKMRNASGIHSYVLEYGTDFIRRSDICRAEALAFDTEAEAEDAVYNIKKVTYENLPFSAKLHFYYAREAAEVTNPPRQS